MASFEHFDIFIVFNIKNMKLEYLFISLVSVHLSCSASDTTSHKDNGDHSIEVISSKNEPSQDGHAIEMDTAPHHSSVHMDTPAQTIAKKEMAHPEEKEIKNVTSAPPEIDQKSAEDETEEPAASLPLATTPSHDPFDGLLKKYVTSNGMVNYEGFKNERSKLDAYLTTLAATAPSSDWSKNEKLAYWINLYNAATIQLILKNYPLKSIMEINGGKAWDVAFVKSGSKTLSLNQIENEIIRPVFKEPRIHFAVNCAAKSCPKLLNEAFTASKLDVQLETATRKFINNRNENKVSPDAITISKIFEWYAADFGGTAELVKYFNKYSSLKVNSDAKVTFMEYDWSLNN